MATAIDTRRSDFHVGKVEEGLVQSTVRIQFQSSHYLAKPVKARSKRGSENSGSASKAGLASRKPCMR